MNKNETHQTSNDFQSNMNESPMLDFCHTSAKVNQLCSGSVLRTPADSKGLKCLLLHKKMFYLMLGPFKLETLNLSPFVGQIHNFMSHGEMAWFKDFSRGRIRASKMKFWLSRAFYGWMVSYGRQSNCWLKTNAAVQCNGHLGETIYCKKGEHIYLCRGRSQWMERSLSAWEDVCKLALAVSVQ